MQITIGIDISKETLAAYRLPDNHSVQVLAVFISQSES
jgi:hypothetical protein